MTNMRLFRQMGVAVLLVGFASAQDIQYNFDRQTDFSRFHSYKWIDIPGGQQIDYLLARDIREVFEAALGKEGLTKTESDNADLHIGYQVAVNQEKQLVGTGWGYGPGWRRGPGLATASTETILIGSLALDMYDVSRKQLVWRGIATKTIDTKASPETRRKNIGKAAEKMLKKYPPGKTS